ncbi:hypothetical protein JTB14_005308 [Gonioctena quinquepunctata]|nr:hypothetical protein JTB14_005308 [Gonioctena quinquepunctata]
MLEILASQIENASSTTNYAPEFAGTMKNREIPLNFDTQEVLEYNLPFNFEELETAIHVLKNSTPGPDDITNEMLRNLTHEMKITLLKIYNNIFQQTTYPRQWKEAIIVPIPKEGKDPTNPSNYRPISLTCCIGKLLERMVTMEKRNPHPRLLNEIMEAIADLREGTGSSTKSILSQVDSILHAKRKQLKRDENQFHRALKHGVTSGLILLKNGKYKLGLRRKDYQTFKHFRKMELKGDRRPRHKAETSSESWAKSRRKGEKGKAAHGKRVSVYESWTSSETATKTETRSKEESHRKQTRTVLDKFPEKMQISSIESIKSVENPKSSGGKNAGSAEDLTNYKTKRESRHFPSDDENTRCEELECLCNLDKSGVSYAKSVSTSQIDLSSLLKDLVPSLVIASKDVFVAKTVSKQPATQTFTPPLLPNSGSKLKLKITKSKFFLMLTQKNAEEKKLRMNPHQMRNTHALLLAKEKKKGGEAGKKEGLERVKLHDQPQFLCDISVTFL